jgi:predicted transcriptional regulator
LVNRERGELNLMPPEAPKPEAMRNAVVDLLRLRPNESVEGITALLGLEQTLIRATLRALLEAGVIERRPFAYGPGYRLTP